MEEKIALVTGASRGIGSQIAKTLAKKNIFVVVIFMDGGVIVEQGRPEDVIDNPSNERTKAFIQKMEK